MKTLCLLDAINSLVTAISSSFHLNKDYIQSVAISNNGVLMKVLGWSIWKVFKYIFKVFVFVFEINSHLKYLYLYFVFDIFKVFEMYLNTI